MTAAGTFVTVRVSFTDDDGFAESLTSAGLTIPRPPFTVSLSSCSSSHNGDAEFRVTATFSEHFRVPFGCR